MRGVIGTPSLLAWLLSLAVVQCVEAGELSLRHHSLDVQLDPARHALVARDTITLSGEVPHDQTVRMVLNRELRVDAVMLGSNPVPFQEKELDGKDFGIEEASEISHGRIIEMTMGEAHRSSSSSELTLAYHGWINEPPQASKGLRFVRPDTTNGHIGPEGVYVSSETFWYPHIPGSLATFDVRVAVPEGWESVTQGRQISHQVIAGKIVTEWQGERPAEALTLVANRFVKAQRTWRGVELATYLFPEDAHLAQEYLDAAAKYLQAYSSLLGPYPFAKFAMVENFFPSGLGMPSFTLLGSRVVKRKYVQPYSLGHEIVHSWIGNAVLNHADEGNWVEGLTTYLANYYYDELYGEPDVAIHHRRKMLLEYSLYVYPEDDYALVQFHHKETQQDNAIGYQKGAMVFHMLRREIGDPAFFQAIRAVVHHYQGKYANWNDLQREFEKTAARKLGWFFRQWVRQPGAPDVKLIETVVRPSFHSRGGFEVNGAILQTGTPYRMQVPVVLHLAGGGVNRTVIPVTSQREPFSMTLPSRPTHLMLDPDFEVFRRLNRSNIPPMLNLWATDKSRAVVVPHTKTDEEWAPYRAVLQRTRLEEPNVMEETDEVLAFGEQSLLVLGGPDMNRMAKPSLDSCGGRVTLKPDHITIQGREFVGPGIAVLISCPRPSQPGRVVTVFYGFSPKAVAQMARLLFFYGWDSYLVFRDGNVLARGDFSLTVNDKEVRFDAS